MSVARITEITVSSPNSFDDAIQLGIARANKTSQFVKNISVEDQNVVFGNGKITAYRVVMMVTVVSKD